MLDALPGMEPALPDAAVCRRVILGEAAAGKGSLGLAVCEPGAVRRPASAVCEPPGAVYEPRLLPAGRIIEAPPFVDGFVDVVSADTDVDGDAGFSLATFSSPTSERGEPAT